VHWRLRPQQALNNILPSMSPLAISNRANTFVFEVHGNIYYIQLRIREADDVAINMSPVTADVSQLVDDAPATAALTHRRSATAEKVPSSALLSSGGVKSYLQEQNIILQIYGICMPPKDVTQQFVVLVESKLLSITQTVLSTFLSRASTPRLTKADIEFLIPQIRPPSRLLRVHLPGKCTDFALFLAIARQVFLASGLNSLAGIDVVQSLRQRYAINYGLAPISSPEHAG
jgi:hypothetical protein